MKKINIVKKGVDYTRIIKKNNIFKNNCFYIFTEVNDEAYYKIGITIPTKIGNAVVRNKIKRRIKSIMDNNKDLILNGYNYIILVRKDIITTDFDTINKNMNFCLSKIKEKRK